MSYGIIRIQKFGASAVKGIEIHDQRQKDVSHTNLDIDRTKSADNYTLQACESFSSGVKQRIQELDLKRTPQKNAVMMCQALITSNKEFFDQRPVGQQKQFFVDAFKFVKEQYGAENIISATVHLDEKTPHLHVNFVPVTDDGRLSAKRLITRESLRQLQTDFFNSVGSKHGLKRGESREEKRKHLSTEEYKQETRKARIIEISASLDKQEIEIEEREIKIEQDIERIQNSPILQIEKIKESDIYPRQYRKNKFLVLKHFENEAEIAERLNKNFIEPLAEKAKLGEALATKLYFTERDLTVEKNQALIELKRHQEKSEKYDALVQNLNYEQVENLKIKAESYRQENAKQQKIKQQQPYKGRRL